MNQSLTKPVDTKKVVGRRQLRFSRVEEILHDAERVLAGEYETLGNLSAGQILMHLARSIDLSIDGLSERPPWLVRLLARWFFKKRVLRRGMPAGVKLPAKFAKLLLPPPTPPEAGLKGLREAMGRLQSTAERAPSPLFGLLSAAEWDQLHCRHAELHLSFLVPRVPSTAP